MAFELYVAQCSANGKQYVGITTRGYRARWTRHVVDARNGSQTAFHKAIRKHGSDAFQLAVLCKPQTLERLKQAEVWAIEKLNTLAPRGYNLTRGGDGTFGAVMPESWHEFKRSLSVSMRGRKMPREAVEKAAASRRGRPLSEEHRKKLSEAKRGKALPQEVKDKLSDRLKGRKLSEEHRARVSAAQKGKQLTPEHREKLRIARQARAIRERAAKEKT